MLEKMSVLSPLFLLMTAIACVHASEEGAYSRDGIPGHAEGIRPVMIGQTLPKIILRTIDGAPFDLNAAVTERPAVLILFRGGWCPYCNLHLAVMRHGFGGHVFGPDGATVHERIYGRVGEIFRPKTEKEGI